ncbi:MAG TPA: ABC transporter permease [Thermoanaerobaculia bacterium]|nr:ABC transporter permease [Thermoanaerobaculia bacterium]
MRALQRKLLRDSIHMAGQLGAIALIVASAIATYVTMRGSYEALREARTAYYGSHRFAQVFAQVKRAPLRVVDDIAALPGVSVVEPRIVVDVKLDVPRLDEPASARIVSMGRQLNLVRLVSGRLPEPGAEHEIVASQQFAKANRLRIGDPLSAVLNGKWEPLRIVGIGGSPEYVVEIAGAAVIPDNRRFAVLWMGRQALEGAFSMRGAFNDVAILLAPGADERLVIDRVDALLSRYGGPGAFGRSEHHPHKVIDSEIVQLRVTALVIPAIFLFVAAFLINMVLSRVVLGQRDQIAILKAFGYSNAAIARHYAGFAVIIVVAGALLGVPLGVWLGQGMTSLYLDFFSLPSLRFTIAPASVAISVIVTAIAAIAAALRSALSAAAIPPAEGMRGEQPPAFHATPLEPLHRFVSPPGRMIMRSIERRPVRAALSAFGIALAVMMLVVGRYTFDAIDALLTIHLRVAERHDVMVTFTEPVRSSVQYDLARLPGVRRVEMFRALPVRISAGPRSRRVALMGLPEHAEMRRLVDRNRRVVPLAERGVVLTKTLADTLGVKPGSHVQMEMLDGKRATFDVTVAGTVDELLGISAYARDAEVARLAGQSDMSSGAYLSIDSRSRRQLDRMLKTMPAVAGVVYREMMLQSYIETIAKSLSTSTTAIVTFACLIAFGVVYNSARIALSERGRDLATLRVLGFSRAEVALLLLGEQGVLTFAGIPIGFVLGRLIAGWLVHLFDTEEYRLVETVSAQTYAFAFMVVVAASAISAAAVWRRIARLDLVEVLKTRE